MIPRIILIVTLGLTIGMAQEKSKQPAAPAAKKTLEPAAKDTLKPAVTDTLVSRAAMLTLLRTQQSDLRKQAEAGLLRLQGTIDGFELQTSDSVRVPKSIFR